MTQSARGTVRWTRLQTHVSVSGAGGDRSVIRPAVPGSAQIVRDTVNAMPPPMSATVKLVGQAMAAR